MSLTNIYVKFTRRFTGNAENSLIKQSIFNPKPRFGFFGLKAI